MQKPMEAFYQVKFNRSDQLLLSTSFWASSHEAALAQGYAIADCQFDQPVWDEMIVSEWK